MLANPVGPPPLRAERGEAEFFESDDELPDQVRYHGERPDERARPASAGGPCGPRSGHYR
jgi:hypothetical protein